MTQANPEKPPRGGEPGEEPGEAKGENPRLEFESFKPSPLPDERLTEIRTRSAERFDAYDSDTRWLLRYVDMLRKDDLELRKRRTSFEHKMFTAVIVLVGMGVLGAIAYNVYVQPTQELFPGCTYGTYHSCAAWISDYAEPLVRHPH